MTARLLILLALLAESSSAAAATFGADPDLRQPLTVDVQAVAGRKRLPAEYRSLANQACYGIQTTIHRGGGVGLAADAFSSRASTAGEYFAFSSATHEIALGLRGRVDAGRVRGELGAGVSLVGAEFHTALYAFRTTPMRAGGAGVWTAAGVRVSLSRSIELGADARYSFGRAYRGSHYSVPTGGLQVSTTIGYRFGARAARVPPRLRRDSGIERSPLPGGEN